MRAIVVSFVAALVVAAFAGSAEAATRKDPPGVMRSASGTVIQPTRTIIHHLDGRTTIIVVPRRSYLDVGTNVPVGYGSHMDYAFPPDGDPGRPYWFYGPDVRGTGSFPIPPAFYIPGWNPNNPF
jgi:hypothetical protein